MVDTAVLATVPLFASLDETQLKAIAPWFELRSVSEGTELIGEGASGYTFFILTGGSAVVAADNAPVAELAAGDCFGEAAILGDGRRDASVTTTSPCQVLVMFGTEFRRLQQAQPQIAAAIEEIDRQRHAAAQ
jgi:CRP-like cAMP-binding protein